MHKFMNDYYDYGMIENLKYTTLSFHNYKIVIGRLIYTVREHKKLK